MGSSGQMKCKSPRTAIFNGAQPRSKGKSPVELQGFLCLTFVLTINELKDARPSFVQDGLGTHDVHQGIVLSGDGNHGFSGLSLHLGDDGRVEKVLQIDNPVLESGVDVRSLHGETGGGVKAKSNFIIFESLAKLMEENREVPRHSADQDGSFLPIIDVH